MDSLNKDELSYLKGGMEIKKCPCICVGPPIEDGDDTGSGPGQGGSTSQGGINDDPLEVCANNTWAANSEKENS